MRFLLNIVFLLAIPFNQAIAHETEIHTIEIVNHKFVPSIIEGSEGKVIKLEIKNQDKTVEEFESFDLKREKIVPGNKKIVITVGPLKKGEYIFFGDFHQETAQGKLIIK